MCYLEPPGCCRTSETGRSPRAVALCQRSSIARVLALVVVVMVVLVWVPFCCGVPLAAWVVVVALRRLLVTDFLTREERGVGGWGIWVGVWMGWLGS